MIISAVTGQAFFVGSTELRACKLSLGASLKTAPFEFSILPFVVKTAEEFVVALAVVAPFGTTASTMANILNNTVNKVTIIKLFLLKTG